MERRWTRDQIGRLTATWREALEGVDTVDDLVRIWNASGPGVQGRTVSLEDSGE